MNAVQQYAHNKAREFGFEEKWFNLCESRTEVDNVFHSILLGEFDYAKHVKRKLEMREYNRKFVSNNVRFTSN